MHPVGGGVELGACDLTGAVDLEEYKARISAYAAANPDAAWITGGGWSMETFPGGIPDRRVLDELVPDRPVFLPNRDHHGAWVNTRALEIAGIDAHTPDPVDGRIEREPDGTPIGALQEGAMELVTAHVPEARTRSWSQACCEPRSSCTRSASPPGRTHWSAPTSGWATSPAPTGPRWTGTC